MTDSCELLTFVSTGVGVFASGETRSLMCGRDFEGEVIVADCRESKVLSLSTVGKEGLENMARFSFCRRLFEEAGDTMGGMPSP